MSGIDTPNATKQKDTLVCASCINSVVQTVSYFREQNKKLRLERANLKEEIIHSKKIGEERIHILTEKIRALEEEIATLKNTA